MLASLTVGECVLCYDLATEAGFLCDQCLAALGFAKHACKLCSQPLTQPGWCFRCSKQPACALDWSHCSYLFSSPLAGWIRQYKDRHYLHWLPRLSWLMQQRPPAFLTTKFDAICYVPSPTARLLWRGFNPAELLAKRLAKHLKLPVLNHVLKRKSNKDQRQLGRKARLLNSQQGIAAGKQKVAGLNILLIEDVITTGATSQTVAAILKQQGAACVCVWALAKVARH